jgi:branched-chain amino acid transport system substrate-binding protein
MGSPKQASKEVRMSRSLGGDGTKLRQDCCKNETSFKSFTKERGLKMLRVLAAVFVIFTVLCGQAVEAKPIVIGVATDTQILDGFATIRGLKLAVEEINAEGGVSVAGQKRPFKIEIMDTRDCEPGVPVSEALLVMEKIILDKGADFVIGPSRSEAAIAALGIISQYKKIYLSTCGCLSPKFHKTIAKDYDRFKYAFRITGEAGRMVGEAIDLLDIFDKKYGMNKMFVLVQDVGFARAGGDIVAKKMKEKGWEISGYERYPTGSTDFSAGLLKTKDSKAQVLFTMGDMPELSVMINQWHDMKIPALPFGCYLGPAMEPGFWKVTKGRGAYTIVNVVNAGNAPSEATPWTMKFYKAYETKWGAEPEGYGTSSGYMAPYIIKDAVERAGTLDADSLVSAFEKTDLIGVYGRIRFDPKSHQIIPANDPNEGAVGTMFQWQDGKRVVIYPPKIAVGEIQFPPWME